MSHSIDEVLQAHFEKFAPSVVVGDRVGRDQSRFQPKPAAVPAPSPATEPGPARPPGSRRGLFAKVAAKGKQLGQIREHDDQT